eukprot:m.31466 g.31466  ORF g.31466 m.31466 type:complete len:705 (+) comp31492_c0_seq10:16-2130(+)
MASESDGTRVSNGSKNEKKTWEDVLRQINQLDEEENAGKSVPVSSHLLPFKFKQEDLRIYGQWPSIECRALVVCDVCRRHILMSAFRHHYESRHVRKAEPKDKRKASPADAGESATVDSPPPPAMMSTTRPGAISRPPCKRSKHTMHPSMYGEGSPIKVISNSAKRKITLPPPNMQKVRDFGYDPNRHCGVRMPDQKRHCHRSLTCKTHSLGLRRKVPGRRKPFDDLLTEHRQIRLSLMADQPAEHAVEANADLSPGVVQNHRMHSPASQIKKVTPPPKREVADEPVVIGEEQVDIVLDSGQIDDVCLPTCDTSPMPVAVCVFGGKRLQNGSTCYTQSMDKLRSHLQMLKTADKQSVPVKNLGKPLDVEMESPFLGRCELNCPAMPLSFKPISTMNGTIFAPPPLNHGETSKDSMTSASTLVRITESTVTAVSKSSNPGNGALHARRAPSGSQRQKGSRRSRVTSQGKPVTPSHVSSPQPPSQQQQTGLLMQPTDQLLQNSFPHANGFTFDGQEQAVGNLSIAKAAGKPEDPNAATNVQLQATNLVSIPNQLVAKSNPTMAHLTQQQQLQILHQFQQSKMLGRSGQPPLLAQQLAAACYPQAVGPLRNFLVHPQQIQGASPQGRVNRPAKLDLAVKVPNRPVALQPKQQIVPSPTGAIQSSNPPTPVRAILPNATPQQRVVPVAPIPSPSQQSQSGLSQVSTVT